MQSFSHNARRILPQIALYQDSQRAGQDYQHTPTMSAGCMNHGDIECGVLGEKLLVQGMSSWRRHGLSHVQDGTESELTLSAGPSSDDQGGYHSHIRLNAPGLANSYVTCHNSVVLTISASAT